MTDKKKISILERLLDERDAQIRELQQQNAELEEMIDVYSESDDEIKELRNLIIEAKQLNNKLNVIKNDQLRLKKKYKKDIESFFNRHKMNRL